VFSIEQKPREFLRAVFSPYVEAPPPPASGWRRLIQSSWPLLAMLAGAGVVLVHSLVLSRGRGGSTESVFAITFGAIFGVYGALEFVRRLRAMTGASAVALERAWVQQCGNLALEGRIEYRVNSRGIEVVAPSGSTSMNWADQQAGVSVSPYGVVLVNHLADGSTRGVLLPAVMLADQMPRVLEAMFLWTRPHIEPAGPDAPSPWDQLAYHTRYEVCQEDLEGVAKQFTRADESARNVQGERRMEVVATAIVLGVMTFFLAIRLIGVRGSGFSWTDLASSEVLLAPFLAYWFFATLSRYRSEHKVLAQNWAAAGPLVSTQPPIELIVSAAGLNVRASWTWIHVRWREITGIHELKTGTLYTHGYRTPFLFLPIDNTHPQHAAIATMIRERVAQLGGPDANRVRLIVTDRDVGCPKCGYNMRGIESLICPECGIKLDRKSFPVAFPEDRVQRSFSLRR